MNRSTSSLSFLLAAGILLLSAGCSQQSKIERHLERADTAYQAGEFDEARLEYMNVLQIDSQNGHALEHLGLTLMEQGTPLLAAPYLYRARELSPSHLVVRLKFAQVLAGAGDRRQSRQEVLEVLKLQPTNTDGLLLLSDLAQSPQEIDECRRDLDLVRNQAGEVGAFRVAEAVLSLKENDPAAAEGKLLEALTLDPKSAAAHLTLSAIYFSRTNIDAADRAAKQAYDLAPQRSTLRLRYPEFKIRTGEIEAGRQLLEEVVGQVPDYVPALSSLAQLEFDQRRTNECAALLKRILQRDPSNLEGLLLSARLKLVGRDLKGSQAILLELAKAYPNSPPVHYQLGIVELLLQQPEEAIKSLKRALQLNPDMQEAALLLAQTQMGVGDPDAAADVLQTILQRSPNNLRAQFQLARARTMQNRLDEALNLYRPLAAQEPKNAEVHYLIGLLQRQQNRTAEARASFEAALAVATNYFAAINQLVDLNLQERDYATARQRTGALVKMMPDSSAAYVLLGRVAAAQGETEQAEAAWTKAGELEPADGRIHQLLAQLYLSSGRSEQAIAKLNESLVRDPNDQKALLMLAMIYNQKMDYGQARDFYERLLKLNPGSGLSLNNLAYLYSEHLNDRNRALSLAQEARRRYPQDPAVADTLGWVLVQRSDYRGALPLLLESASKLEGQSEVLFHLGIAHYQLGNEEAARAALQKATNTSEDFPGRDRAIQCLKVLAIDPRTASAQSLAELESMTQANPNDPVAATRLGARLEQNQQWAEARSLYERVHQSNTNAALPLIRLALLEATQFGNSPRALQLARQARELAPRDPQAAQYLGRVAVESGDPEWALTLLQEASRSGPTDPGLMFDLARAELLLGRVAQAKASAEAALKSPEPFSDIEEARLMQRMCRLYLDLATIQSAEKEIGEYARMHPTNPAVLMTVGALQESIGGIPDATATWENALALYPSFALAHKHLTSLWLREPSDPAKAYGHGKEARRCYPTDPEVAKSFGIAAFRVGESRQAVEALSESAAKLAEDAELFHYLGMASYAVRDLRSARRALEKSLDLNANGPSATEARRMLAELGAEGR